jgi:hypothetical protein
LPSTFLVTNLADAGSGSLRDAVLQANTTPGADTIRFAGGLAGTIPLSSGELNITDDLTIDAPGQGRLTVSGSNASRVFQVAAGVNATLDGLTITLGRATEGAGVRNAGNLTISHSALSSNQAVNGSGDAQGGGIFNAAGATLTLDHCTLTGNLAAGSARGKGGGLMNNGQASVSHTTFADNRSVGGSAGNFISSSGRGGAIQNENGATLAVDHSTFEDNQAIGGAGRAGGAGALYNLDATADVSYSTFDGNRAVGGDGSGGAPAGFGLGGALLNFSNVTATLTVRHSTFANNQALGGNGGPGSWGGSGVGGALWTNTAGATGTVEDSSFTGNLARGGQRGAADGDFLNGSGLGGAIGNGFEGSLVVSNSTLSGNVAQGGDGLAGIAGGLGLGGGLLNIQGGLATVEQSHLTGNLAVGGAGGNGADGGDGRGGGLFNGLNDADAAGNPIPSVVTVLGTHVTDNQAGGGAAGAGGAAGLGQGGGLYNDAGAIAYVDAQTKIKHNKATTGGDDAFGTVTPI